jgi:hypothetical protein
MSRRWTFDCPKLLDNIRNPVLNSLNEYSLIIIELSYRGIGAYLLEADGAVLTSEFCLSLADEATNLAMRKE